jgi:flagellar protein FliT
MAVSDWMAAFALLKECTERMLLAAKAEDWEVMLQHSQSFGELSLNLPIIQWGALTGSEQQQLAALMRVCNEEVQEMEQMAVSQRGVLAALLQNLHNTGKLQRAYDV